MNIIKRKFVKSNTDQYVVFSLDHEFDETTIIKYTDEESGATDRNQSVIIEGICDSRLNELKKYGFGGSVSDRYIVSTGIENGVVLSQTNTEKITYRVDNILFVDNLITQTTTFKLNTSVKSGFLNKIDFVDDKYYGFIDIKIKNNLLIDRQNISILQDHYRLNAIKNVNDFEIYGGGYFNVFKI